PPHHYPLPYTTLFRSEVDTADRGNGPVRNAQVADAENDLALVRHRRPPLLSDLDRCHVERNRNGARPHRPSFLLERASNPLAARDRKSTRLNSSHVSI